MWVHKNSERFIDQVLAPGTSVEQQVGDHYCPKAGWLLAWATTIPPTNGAITASIDVAGPGPANLLGTLVESFSPGTMGQLYIPWPKVNLVVTSNAGLPGVGTWRLNAMPGDDSSQAAGLPMCVDVAQDVILDPTFETTIPWFDGATSWSFWGDENTTALVEPTDPSGNVRGRWLVGGGAAPGITVGTDTVQPWRRTFRDGSVRILNNGGNPLQATFFQRYDWKTWGDSA